MLDLEKEVDIDKFIGGGVVTCPVREVGETWDRKEEREEEEVGREFEEGEEVEGEEIKVLERIGEESDSR